MKGNKMKAYGKVYISTPMSGVEEEVIRANVRRGIAYCQKNGYEFVSPVEISAKLQAANPDDVLPWSEYLLADLQELKNCDEILLVSVIDGTDWRLSKGCKTEVMFASGCGITIRELQKNGTTKELKEKATKLAAERFDPTTLQPFDQILCRERDNEPWRAAIMSHFCGKQPITTDGYNYYQVIPDNIETRRLWNTEIDCRDYYKWWEKE